MDRALDCLQKSERRSAAVKTGGLVPEIKRRHNRGRSLFAQEKGKRNREKSHNSDHSNGGNDRKISLKLQ